MLGKCIPRKSVTIMSVVSGNWLQKKKPACTMRSVLVLVLVFVSEIGTMSVPIKSSPPLDDLESLQSSKILMDHTSSTSSISYSHSKMTAETQASSLGRWRRGRVEMGKEEVREKSGDLERTPYSSQLEVVVSSSSPIPKVSSLEKKMMMTTTMSSPLHVARCRATCVEKFTQTSSGGDDQFGSATTMESVNTSDDAAERMMMMTHLLPILRLRRKKRATSSTPPLHISTTKSSSGWSCVRDSVNCLDCWKDCELLEPEYTGKDERPEGSIESNTESKQTKKLACSSKDSSECKAGCQVACSFYERLLTRKTEQDGASSTLLENISSAFSSGRKPVVATEQKSVVSIVPGKITWPAKAGKGRRDGSKETPLSSPESGRMTTTTKKTTTATSEPLVYVVIQEYPDRKWRQIAQTTEREVEIPRELTSAMERKLRSVRVLVVGPEGLLSVYSPETGAAKQLPDNPDNNNNSEKVAAAVLPATNVGVTNDAAAGEEGSDGNATSTEESTAPETQAPPVSDSNWISLPANTNDLSVTSSTTPDGSDDSPATTYPAESHPSPTHSGEEMEEPFQLRRVSLIHQKSLVIAELRWNGMGSNPSQEYLITWELTGGGLKGHLVTDSTSVTLSLWPDTLYRIQVELFEQNLDSDGEQPAESSALSPKSLTLTVDTSEASFPLESPSALLGSGEEDDEEEQGEDDLEDESAEGRSEEEPSHKSINMTLVFTISALALLSVLVVLALAAFSWTWRLRQKDDAHNSSCPTLGCSCHSGKGVVGLCCCSRYGGCFSKEEQLLHEDDDSDSTSFPSPLYFAVAAKKHKKSERKQSFQPFSFGTSQGKTPGQESAPPPITVAVISRSSSSGEVENEDDCSSLNYYNLLSSATSTGKVGSSFSTRSMRSSDGEREHACPSSSSCWLPNATCTPPATSSPSSNSTSPVTTTTTTTKTKWSAGFQYPAAKTREAHQ